ncbi:MAG: MotA/TolQ/ExbB proton channel family protein, partial [Acidobacteria bacterium]|nr:MotA/TolQ/ExbB proton channel family protein [Acidobacteriota bacterium]
MEESLRGDDLTVDAPFALLLQNEVVQMIMDAGPVSKAVLVVLLLFSILSWTIIFAKLSALRRAKTMNEKFLAAFRQTQKLAEMNTFAAQFRPAPLAVAFEFGYQEVERQVNGRGRLHNLAALQRAMQLGSSEELTRLERNMSWLATTASSTPFIGLFGTVWGIIDAFRGLAIEGGASLRAVAPGIAEALIATAFGLMAAIPAVISYNYFLHRIKEMGARLEDFGS